VRNAFAPDEERFRSEVRELLADYRDLDGYFQQGHRWPRVRALFEAMGERGWLALAWPESEGGLGRGPAYEYLLWDEAAYARAARNPLASGIVARTLIRYGTPQQRAEWLPAIRSGRCHFSLAYSEPEAGSDLAGLRTRAEQHGDVYVVNGDKCWQSYAQDMDYLWLLVRTGDLASRGAGTTLMIADIRTPGIEVRPLPTLDGDQLNEIHFEDAEIPAANVVGPVDGAWPLMGEALADERHIQFPPGRLRRDLEEMTAWLAEAGLAGDPLVRARLADLVVDVAEAEIHALRVLDLVQKGRDAVAAAAANKVVHTLGCQAIARAVVELAGPEALVDSARPSLLWRQSLWETIGGGTTEIMRSVVAKQSLGLAGRR